MKIQKVFFKKIKLISMAIVFNGLAIYSPSYAMQIGFEYDNLLDPQHKNILNQAAARLSNVILTTYNKPSDQKFDLVVRVSLRDLDGEGNTLAEAGPTKWFQSSTNGPFYPYRGEMTIDSADLKDPGLYNIVTHEIVHALGFGIFWEDSNLVKFYGQHNPCFIGKNAIQAYSNLSGKIQQAVPLENKGGPGTMGAHWREIIFDNELMTGIYNTDQPNPLSILTLAALQDMGYEVDYSRAESYSLPHSSSFGQSHLRKNTNNRKRYHNCRGHSAPSCGCHFM
ncbi:leishmanolysin-related zinc metalloendopeptidase [Candidatus Paracaedibacter symbiosus]|uniref:leishmanolysin-related zinc metalloendopeptidase n=1 Tax=Candidatus Paracaedibacter symbiosus TaxID=244582 RepID=UPI00068E6B10|nr:leishmanolysin-related zinc metalloendopeptidase [Candidatus Paracaedibacter symbiosus]